MTYQPGKRRVMGLDMRMVVDRWDRCRYSLDFDHCDHSDHFDRCGERWWDHSPSSPTHFYGQDLFSHHHYC